MESFTAISSAALHEFFGDPWSAVLSLMVLSVAFLVCWYVRNFFAEKYRSSLAFRYLWARKINFLAMLGVTLVVMALIVVNSVMNGFSRQMRSVVRGTLSHITVTYSEDALGMSFDDVMEKLGTIPEIKARSPFLSHFALLGRRIDHAGRERLTGDTASAGEFRQITRWYPAEIRAIDPALELQATDLEKYLVCGAFEIHNLPRKLYIKHLNEDIDPAIETVAAAIRSGQGDAAELGRKLEFLKNRRRQIQDDIRETEKRMETFFEPEKDPEKRKDIKNRKLRGKYIEDVAGIFNDKSENLGCVLIGSQLAWAYQIRVGEVLDIATTRTSAGPPVFNQDGFARHALGMKHFVVVGIFKSGHSETDARQIYIDLADGLELFREKNPHGISVMIGDYRDVDDVKTKILNTLAIPFDVNEKRGIVRTWQEQRQTILRAVEFEKTITSVILFFLGIVSAFLIFAVLSQSVTEKTRDIGILRSIGGSSVGVMSVFLTTGLTIGMVGSLLGVLAGRLFEANINKIAGGIEFFTGWKVFDPEVYYFDKIPTDPSWRPVLLIVSFIVLATFCFALWPAYRAARVDPVKTLRYE